jgi:hypothetical protein
LVPWPLLSRFSNEVQRLVMMPPSHGRTSSS